MPSNPKRYSHSSPHLLSSVCVFVCVTHIPLSCILHDKTRDIHSCPSPLCKCMDWVCAVLNVSAGKHLVLNTQLLFQTHKLDGHSLFHLSLHLSIFFALFIIPGFKLPLKVLNSLPEKVFWNKTKTNTRKLSKLINSPSDLELNPSPLNVFLKTAKKFWCRPNTTFLCLYPPPLPSLPLPHLSSLPLPLWPWNRGRTSRGREAGQETRE